jgi:hypothetical protein
MHRCEHHDDELCYNEQSNHAPEEEKDSEDVRHVRYSRVVLQGIVLERTRIDSVEFK